MPCRQGLSVQELYEQLTSEEKYQGVGGALQVKAPNPADQYRISGHVFAQWLSIVYMTFVQASPCASPYFYRLYSAPCTCHTRLLCTLSMRPSMHIISCMCDELG